MHFCSSSLCKPSHKIGRAVRAKWPLILRPTIHFVHILLILCTSLRSCSFLVFEISSPLFLYVCQRKLHVPFVQFILLRKCTWLWLCSCVCVLSCVCVCARMCEKYRCRDHECLVVLLFHMLLKTLITRWFMTVCVAFGYECAVLWAALIRPKDASPFAALMPKHIT